MINVYINLPNPHITIHQSFDCGLIHAHKSAAESRTIRIEISNLSTELSKFVDGEHKFNASKEFNDMWLEVHLGDLAFEIAVVLFIVAQLGKVYKQFQGMSPSIHC
ncbi:MAG: hypothetical protein CVU42_14030 [Chloroflexi bacterium HGW-Chloroflexi-4]|jgi:hypothetical protein|nr:MAG: hypothetical protein CVU42_14030 [Chloroflexi bacterium HGW-Chloroflexi-4]